MAKKTKKAPAKKKAPATRAQQAKARAKATSKKKASPAPAPATSPKAGTVAAALASWCAARVKDGKSEGSVRTWRGALGSFVRQFGTQSTVMQNGAKGVEAFLKSAAFTKKRDGKARDAKHLVWNTKLIERFLKEAFTPHGSKAAWVARKASL